MTAYTRTLHRLVVAGVLMPALCLPVAAAAPEPVVWTTLGDPDPNFVPPPVAEPKGKQRRAPKAAQPSLDRAMEDLGRVIGQAAELQERRTRQLAQEATDAICESVEARGASDIEQSALCAER